MQYLRVGGLVYENKDIAQMSLCRLVIQGLALYCSGFINREGIVFFHAIYFSRVRAGTCLFFDRSRGGGLCAPVVRSWRTFSCTCTRRIDSLGGEAREYFLSLCCCVRDCARARGFPVYHLGRGG